MGLIDTKCLLVQAKSGINLKLDAFQEHAIAEINNDDGTQKQQRTLLDPQENSKHRRCLQRRATLLATPRSLLGILGADSQPGDPLQRAVAFALVALNGSGAA